MPENTTDLQELKAIIDWVNLTPDVRELSLKLGEVELHVSRHAEGGGTRPLIPAEPAPTPVRSVAQPAAPVPEVPAEPAASSGGAAPSGTGTAPAPDASALAADEVLICAPMVGTFYASAQPGAPAFVAEGDRVRPDSVLGIVEVMKLMNNVEAGVEGTVLRVLVENESLVEYGQGLVLIKKDAP